MKLLFTTSNETLTSALWVSENDVSLSLHKNTQELKNIGGNFYVLLFFEV